MLSHFKMAVDGCIMEGRVSIHPSGIDISMLLKEQLGHHGVPIVTRFMKRRPS